MNGIDLDKLEEIAEGLALGFYLLMFMALLAILVGAAGSGAALLLLGAASMSFAPPASNAPRAAGPGRIAQAGRPVAHVGRCRNRGMRRPRAHA